MTESPPVERVVTLLRGADYDVVRDPVAVASIPFQFDAVLVGKHSLDLVVVVDLIRETEATAIRRQVEGLSRALDLVQSKRSLTVILVGPAPPLDIVHSLSRVARVLAVGTPVGPQASAQLVDALAILLPLTVNRDGGQLVESGLAAKRDLEATFDDPVLADLLAAASSGREAVERALAATLGEPLAALELQ